MAEASIEAALESSSLLFQEPDDFYPPERPATFTQYTLLSGQTLNLRLVGHNPLWVRWKLEPSVP